jgi:hypothetical protein
MFVGNGPVTRGLIESLPSLRSQNQAGVARCLLEWCSTGVLEWCSIGVLEYWSTGVLEYWSVGVLEYWSTGVLVFLSS